MPDSRHDEVLSDQASRHSGPQAAMLRLLATQPDLAARLAAFAGETVALEVQPFGVRWLVRLGNPPTVLDAAQALVPIEPDLSISGTPGAYLARLAYRDHGSLKVSGDLALAGRLLNLLAAARVDWPALLAPYLGEEVVGHGGRLLGAVGGWLRQGRDAFLLDAEEYLRHELQILPTRAAHDAWLTAVETLRQDTDRLEARLERLEQCAAAGNVTANGTPSIPGAGQLVAGATGGATANRETSTSRQHQAKAGSRAGGRNRPASTREHDAGHNS